MDALLGAAALWDIGHAFPDNDPAYEGISSMVLLERVMVMLKEKGFSVGNVDATIVAQRPKLAGFIPQMYKTSDAIRTLAAQLMVITALAMPIDAFVHATYFTLRSGGKTWITFLFDSAYLWVISIPVARLLSTGTTWHIILVYGICQFIDIVKCIIGYTLRLSRM